ncbi:hypothetical protein HTZ84_05395 [Haloterrigena sp. SYSU A558-1]|uniref:Uncharacterized protein n=1 Tax=Haloterrigena gelatinilytica TaxID=2741724 RepID=A0ABX2L984_9EURY|nr:hypothetical protein [Haloterrigena gelatinilytica]NUC71749.1 hypothetical protein [Haloterrigena gelatinilytica]
MTRECADCGATTAPDRRICRDCSIEDRYGVPSDHFDADAGIVCWVQDLEETWHASMYFEGTSHVAACGEIFETPVADVRDDPRRLAERSTCDACEAALEEDEEEAAADGGFEKASKIATDGGEIDIYQWVLDNVHEYPAGTDSRWGCRGNLVHQGRKLDSVEKADVQEAIGRAVNNEDLISWHGLLARAEVDRLRELVRIEHEEYDITRQILVGKCNNLIEKKKQEEADDGAEPEVAADGGLKEVFHHEAIVATDDGMAIGGNASSSTDHRIVRNLSFPQEQLSLPIGRTRPDESTFAAYTDPQRSQTPTTRSDCACSGWTILITHFLKTLSTSLNLAVVVRSSNDSSVRQCRLLHTETKRDGGVR